MATLGLLAWMTLSVAEPGMTVRLRACDQLDIPTIERLLQVEVDGAIAEARGEFPETFVVEVACEPTDIRITVADPMTDKSLARSIPAPPGDDPEPERTIALAAAQLFAASWLEMLAEADALDGSDESMPNTKLIEAAVGRHMDRPPGALAARPRHGVNLGAGARARGIANPVPLARVGLEYTYWFRRQWGVGPLLAQELGATGRSLGIVRLAVTQFGLRVAWRSRMSRVLSFGFDVEIAADYQRIAGSASESGTRERVAFGFGGEAGANLHIGVQSGSIRTLLAFGGGGLLGGPTGSVENEADVSLTGAWLGSALRVEIGVPVRR